jgi:6-phosphogluconolactonase (cycloisomerase 2 family)
MAVHTSGSYLYVANQTGDTVDVFAIDPTAGTLTELGGPTPVGPTGSEPRSILVHPSGKFAYVSASTGTAAAIFGFSIDTATGALTALPGSTTLTGAGGLACHPTGQFLYAATGTSVDTFTVDATSGALTSLGSFSFGAPNAVACDPTGQFVYATDSPSRTQNGSVDMYLVDGTVGLKGIAPAGAGGTTGLVVGTDPVALACDPRGGFLYSVDFVSGDAWALSIGQTGGLSSIGSAVSTGITAQPGPCSVTVEASGTYLYVANFTESDVGVFAIDATTGAITQVVTAPCAPGTSCVVTAP